MKSILVRLLLVVPVLFMVSSVSDVAIDAKEQQPQQQPPAETTPQRPASPYRAMVFDVKHRDPEALANALQPLQSGQPQTSMVANRQMKTITVRDYPENLAAIGEALRRLDVPEAMSPFRPRPPSSIEFQSPPDCGITLRRREDIVPRKSRTGCESAQIDAEVRKLPLSDHVLKSC